jgi:hypothetical protein
MSARTAHMPPAFASPPQAPSWGDIVLEACAAATLQVFKNWLRAEAARAGYAPRPSARRAAPRPIANDAPEVDERAAARAAALLGIDLDATPDAIRAALRRRMIASAAHPDHGGTSAKAARLIAARDLLLTRTAVRP